jgi:glucosamine--fructose-6-phosphate aminotransferase (isomerizing)
MEQEIYPLFLREIKEQPRVLSNTLAQYLGPGYHLKMTKAPLDDVSLRKISKVYLTASGTSFHAALTARYLIEELAELPTVVEQASECGQHQLLVDNATLAITVSQSGRSKGTIEALELAKRKGAITLALVNEPKSPLAAMAQGYITTLAGRVLTPSSTKAFTSQTLVLGLLAFRLAQARGLGRGNFHDELQQLERLPEIVRRAVTLCEEQIGEIARSLLAYKSIFILASGNLLPMVYDGGLKLKEVARFFAEGASAGEFGHGPLAMAGPEAPVMLLSFNDQVNGSVHRDLALELKKRGSPLIIITEDGPLKNNGLLSLADHSILLPQAPPRFRPQVALIPLQLLACRVGQLKGLDVDRPGGLLYQAAYSEAPEDRAAEPLYPEQGDQRRLVS